MKDVIQLLKSAKKYRAVYEHLHMVTEIEQLGLHPEIKQHLESDTTGFSDHVFTRVTHATRRLIKSGQNTGLESDKPKKGSSRAVLFPKNPHKVTLDGKEAHVPSVVKIAFHGVLDKYNDSGALLGQHQNHTEADYFAQHHWSVLRRTEDHKKDSYETNPHGILPPVFDSHPDDHWLHMGRIRPIKGGEFRELTKTKEFPKGISHDDMYHTLMHHHEQAHGRKYYGAGKVDVNKVTEHPMVSNMLDFVQTMGQHPGDYVKGNMGIFEHPHGSRHIVISDYGFSHAVAHEYNNARKKMSAEMAKGRW